MLESKQKKEGWYESAIDFQEKPENNNQPKQSLELKIINYI